MSTDDIKGMILKFLARLDAEQEQKPRRPRK